MTNEQKKSTSGEAPIPKQDYGTTPAEKSEAERLFDRISTGAARAIARPKDAKVARPLRKLIADANLSGDCIINDGSGYFRPGEDDDVAFETYIRSERSRAREILKKTASMQRVFDRRYQYWHFQI